MTHKWIAVLTVVRTTAVVAIDATDAALGAWAGSFMSILIAISVLGAANGVIIYGGRYLVMNLLSSPLSGSWTLGKCKFRVDFLSSGCVHYHIYHTSRMHFIRM